MGTYIRVTRVQEKRLKVALLRSGMRYSVKGRECFLFTQESSTTFWSSLVGQQVKDLAVTAAAQVAVMARVPSLAREHVVGMVKKKK